MALACPWQGSVLLSLGVIEDLQPKMVEKGRKDLEKSMKKFRKLPEVAASEQAQRERVEMSDSTQVGSRFQLGR